MTNDDPMYVRQLEEARDAAELEIKALEDQLRERDSFIAILEAQLQPPLSMGEPKIPRVNILEAAIKEWALACKYASDPTIMGSTCRLIRAESELLELSGIEL